MKGINLGSKNGMWKGNKVSYGALHDWIKWHKPKQNRCSVCNKKTDFLDLANISQKYKRDLSDWEWLCRRCHMTKDGRINNLCKGIHPDVVKDKQTGRFQKSNDQSNL
jgi:hypothetical protein